MMQTASHASGGVTLSGTPSICWETRPSLGRADSVVRLLSLDKLHPLSIGQSKMHVHSPGETMDSAEIIVEAMTVCALAVVRGTASEEVSQDYSALKHRVSNLLALSPTDGVILELHRGNPTLWRLALEKLVRDHLPDSGIDIKRLTDDAERLLSKYSRDLAPSTGELEVRRSEFGARDRSELNSLLTIFSEAVSTATQFIHWSKTVELLKSKGDSDTTIEDVLRYAIKKEYSNTLPARTLARFLSQRERYVEAEEVYRQASADPFVLAEFAGWLRARPGREVEAEQAYRSAKKQGVPYAARELAQLLAAQPGRFAEADAAYREAAAAGSVEAALELADRLRSRSDWSALKDMYNEIIKATPSSLYEPASDSRRLLLAVLPHPARLNEAAMILDSTLARFSAATVASVLHVAREDLGSSRIDQLVEYIRNSDNAALISATEKLHSSYTRTASQAAPGDAGSDGGSTVEGQMSQLYSDWSSDANDLEADSLAFDLDADVAASPPLTADEVGAGISSVTDDLNWALNVLGPPPEPIGGQGQSVGPLLPIGSRK